MIEAMADDVRGVACEAHEPITDMALDLGIRHAVLILRSGGIETFESCEGGPGHAFAEPTVKFHGGSWEGYRALAWAMEHGLPVRRVQMVYGIVNGHPEGPWWELVLHPTTGATA